MTQEHTEAVDEITQAQQEIDATQESPGEPQPATMEQVRELIQQQGQSHAQQISGLASKIDTGLNAVRRDTQAWAKEQVGDLRSEMGRESWLAGLEPDQRPMAESLLKEIDRGRPAQPAQQPEVTQPAAQPPIDQWESVKAVARDFGVDPEDKRIDYAAFTDANIPDGERRTRFLGSLRTIITAAPAQTPAVVTQPAQTANPPVETAAASRSNGYRNADGVRDAYMADRIDLPEFTRLLANYGETP